MYRKRAGPGGAVGQIGVVAGGILPMKTGRRLGFGAGHAEMSTTQVAMLPLAK